MCQAVTHDNYFSDIGQGNPAHDLEWCSCHQEAFARKDGLDPVQQLLSSLFKIIK